MWWLQKNNLTETEGEHKGRHQSAFLLRHIHKPNTNPLRTDRSVPNAKRTGMARRKLERFPIPVVWHDRMSSKPPKENACFEVKSKSTPYDNSKAEVLSIQEKRRILKEQEGFVVKKRARWKKVLQNLDELSAQFLSSTSPDWIGNIISIGCKSAAGEKGNIARLSPLGMGLQKKSPALRLWHEDVSNSEGRSVTGIILSSSLLPRSNVDQLDYGLEVCRPIANFLRVDVLPEFHAPKRIPINDQKAALQKGGHGVANKQIADYTVLVESFRRDQSSEKVKDEAKAALCLGILHDNAQEFTKALKCYQRFVELSKQTGDIRGECMGYNFIGCSLQEDEDLKLAKAKNLHSVGSKIRDLPTSAIIQYEKALEFHKKHEEIADLEQKFVAFTNIGLLCAALSRWTDAARYHKKALKCATYLERPQDQSVAVGNLGFILCIRGKYGASSLCLKRYLHICEAIHDVHGQARAHYLLGNIAIHRNKFLEGMKAFMASFQAAKKSGDQRLQTMAKILIGYAKGQHTYTRA